MTAARAATLAAFLTVTVIVGQVDAFSSIFASTGSAAAFAIQMSVYRCQGHFQPARWTGHQLNRK